MVECRASYYTLRFLKTNSMRMSIPCRPVSSPMTEFQEHFTFKERNPRQKTPFLLGIALFPPPARNLGHLFTLRCLKLIEKEGHLGYL